MEHIETARLHEIDFAAFRLLEDQAKHEIGRVAPEMVDKYIRRGRLQTLRHGEDLLGYMISVHSALRRTRYVGQSRIYVATVERGVRNLLFGTMLVDDAIARSKLQGNHSIGLWCAEDIEANEFWLALGFTRTRDRLPMGVRKRLHHEYLLLHSPQNHL